MKHAIIVFLGWLFAVGLGLSGMTDVNKVTGFLNLRGDWDPSLMGVMGGGILVYAIGLPLLRKLRKKPFFDASFMIPTRRDIDWRLITGAAIFGLGWGLAGICPGPGITSLVSGNLNSFLFVGGMLASMIAVQQLVYHHHLRKLRKEAPEPDQVPDLT